MFVRPRPAMLVNRSFFHSFNVNFVKPADNNLCMKLQNFLLQLLPDLWNQDTDFLIVAILRRLHDSEQFSPSSCLV